MPTAPNSADTPLMRQYLRVKSDYPDAILFFRLGDFYEMFFDDAVVASQALELTLTTRDKNKQDPVPMCGVPHHAAKGYVRRLLDLGHKIAICEQVEDPRAARGIVRREVTEVITPGVVLETDHLEAKHNNYLVALALRGERAIGLAALDLSTFELRITCVDGVAALVDELTRVAPKEVIYPRRARDLVAPLARSIPAYWQAVDDALTSAAGTDALLETVTGAPLPQAAASPLEVAAAAAALRYAASTQPSRGLPRCRLQRYRAEDHLQLDEATLSNLEILESAMLRQRSGSLLGVLDHTLTAMGGRQLRRWLTLPLRDVSRIRRRHDAVEVLASQRATRGGIRQQLKEVYDLERLTSRVVLQVATPREMARLASSLRQLPLIGEHLQQAAATSLDGELPELLRWPEDQLADLAQEISACLVDDPPAVLKEGAGIRRGYSEELDELIQLCDGGKSQIIAIEQRERQRTGIASLKVRYNKVFGYFIEVTRANLKNVPDDYHRKQTVANAERFVTAELADHEAKVLSAQERRQALEQRLFEQLRQRVAEQGGRLARIARRVAEIDVLCSLAELADSCDYVRPQVDDSSTIEISDGRHPVVERFTPPGEFVANDVRLDEQQRMLIITGPNMAGKSTVMRQVAQIVVLAQMGAFVPARACRVGLVDRIFTRVGASDNLARGESTFMVEMRETATILDHATERSLVVLDEIGRGTATYDGISIAWAVAEQLHDRLRARTLFATHYHELCALAEVKARACNFTMAIREWQGQIVFVRKLVPGASSRSYGIEVARLAGLDRTVLDRSRQVLRALEAGEEVEGLPLRGRGQAPQLDLFARPAPADPCELEQALADLDPERMTPLEALNELARLVEQARREPR